VPLAVIPLEHFLKGEPVTRRAVVGGVIAVAGVIGLTLAR
jgi:drug/metabolite transporter (DMT)-like permease